MRKKLFLIGIVTALISVIPGAVFALPNWDITGTWDMKFYFHTQ